MLAANPRCIIETNDAGGNQLTADYAAARGIDLDGLRVGISGSVGQMFGALFGSEHLGTLLLTGGDTLLQCMNSVGARELEPVCELESGIVLARFAYQGAPATLLPVRRLWAGGSAGGAGRPHCKALKMEADSPLRLEQKINVTEGERP